jgi:hypothetical protein
MARSLIGGLIAQGLPAAQSLFPIQRRLSAQLAHMVQVTATTSWQLPKRKSSCWQLNRKSYAR